VNHDSHIPYHTPGKGNYRLSPTGLQQNGSELKFLIKLLKMLYKNREKKKKKKREIHFIAGKILLFKCVAFYKASFIFRTVPVKLSTLHTVIHNMAKLLLLKSIFVILSKRKFGLVSKVNLCSY
jgi:hypothetical protein